MGMIGDICMVVDISVWRDRLTVAKGLTLYIMLYNT